MASSSATANSLFFSPERRPKKYDVFLSFRGEDTRKNFTSHLYEALCQRNIETYIDDRLDRGDEISFALMKAIEDSYASLIIFSQNYASSKWCLDELTKIMDCKKFKGQIVIPVFYKIDPSHVRKQLGSYKDAFAKYERDFKGNKNKVLKWKSALTEAANLPGWHSQNYRTEYQLVEEVVSDVMQKLKHMNPSELRGLVGIEQNCANIESLLDINSSQVRIIGIWGIGGIGKTTISTVLFAKLSSQYEGKCFLENVRMESKKNGLNHLRNKLLSQLLGEENLHICTPQIASSFALSRLSRRKVFIVLDDLNDSKQLEYLVGEHNCLGQGSKVIVTSRDKHVFSKGVDEIYEVKKLSFNDSIQLFSLNAFNKNNPEIQFEELSARAIIYTRGLPLALKVLGSFLHLKNKEEWDSALRKLQKIPNRNIQDVLKLSYDELDHKEKGIFLDIACFLKGWDKNDVTTLLDACNFYPDIGIRNLIDKTLITISKENTIEMHDLIQEIGWEFVRQESIKDPGKRSRLWDPEDIYYILKHNKGTDAVEGILLDASQFGDLYLTSDVFKNMINLRFLKFNAPGRNRCNIYLPEGLEALPHKLSFLFWREYPSKSLPSTFCAENLVEIFMPHSHVEKLWDGVQNLANITEIVLNGSNKLLELPDLSRASNLKTLSLYGCTSLLKVHPSILSLQKLRRLYLNNCKALKSLRSNIPLKSLKYLSVHGCSSLQDFSVTAKKMRNLYLGSTAINELPSSIFHFEKLDILTFQVTESLSKLPENLVQKLDLSGCSSYEFLTLSNILDSLWHIKELDLSECTLSELPYNINQLVSLQTLSLSESHLVRLPESIKHLSQLKCLNLYRCRKLQCLPELPPLNYLEARDCTSLETVSSLASESLKEHGKGKGIVLLENCLKLGQHALDTIVADFYARIVLESSNFQLSAIANEEGNQEEDQEEEERDEDDSDDEEEAYLSDDDDGKICFCFPGNKFPYWFNYSSKEPFLIVEIPSNLKFLGFAFCVIISAAESDMEYIGNLGCECSFEAHNGETINFQSWFANDNLFIVGKQKLISNHVYLWYDARCCEQIMEAIKSSGENCNMKFSFTFFTETQYFKRVMLSSFEESNGVEDMKEGMIRSCGVQPIFTSEDLIIGEEGNYKENRSTKIHESESIPKIRRQLISPPLSSESWKQNERKGLAEILSSDC